MDRQSYAFTRGIEDATKGRSPLFRSTRVRGIVADWDGPQSNDWTDQMRREYLAGYDEAEANAGAQ